MNEESGEVAALPSRAAGAVRASIGLLQGFVLYALLESIQQKVWPSTDRMLFSAVYAVSIFVPLLLISGLTHLRIGWLAGWTLLATLGSAGLASYGFYRVEIVADVTANLTPPVQVWAGLVIGFFIAQSLVLASASDGRFPARYASYFGTSWKLGLQIVMAVLFTAVLWLVLWLGAELFKLIKIDFLSRLIQERSFAIPATTAALSYALHITDVRVGLIHGVRAVSCNLLSWLLPLLTFIVAAFLITLPFAGLDLLWNTRRATAILLTAAGSLVFLVNAAYQDGARGGDGPPMPRLLDLARVVASVTLVPLVILAGYGLALRIGQYGWSPQRVIATAITTVAACYAIGYVISAFPARKSLRALEVTNILTAVLTVVVLLSLLTPLADPARIAVADQVQRLRNGVTLPEQFDYAFLRFRAGRFGEQALRDLSTQTELPVAAQRSADMLLKRDRFEAMRGTMPVTALDRAANIIVAWPKNRSFPGAFLQTQWALNNYLLPACITGRGKCDAVLIDMDGDGNDEIILLPQPNGQASLFHASKDGKWSYAGGLGFSMCPGVREALIAGTFKLEQPAYKEIEVSGRRLNIIAPAGCAAPSR